MAVGSYSGALPRVDWSAALAGKGPLYRTLHHKSWLYAGLRVDSLFIGIAVVRTGYAANALAWAWDANEEGLLEERVVLGPWLNGSIFDDGPGERRASFQGGGLRIAMDETSIEVDAPRGASPGDGARSASASPEHPFHLRVRLEPSAAPAIAAIVTIPDGVGSATQKHLATATGEVVVGGRRRTIARTPVAFDYTSGLLARHTAWRWALALGTAGGKRIALNLVQGFVGEAECALWIDDQLMPVGEGMIDLDRDRPMRTWTVKTRCGAIDLRFSPGALHAQKRDLVLVRSYFLQPGGRFTGTIRVAGEALCDLDLLGVTEDQDLVW